MNRLLSGSFWMQTFISVLASVIVMYLLISLTGKINIPFLSSAVQEVAN